MKRNEPLKFLLLLLALCFLAKAVNVTGQPSKELTEAEKIEIALEALSRIQSDINTNTALKEAVYKFLAKVRGTSHFVQIVNKFQLKDQNEGLLEVAINKPADEIGVEAMRLILANDNLGMVKKSLANTNGLVAAKTAEVLGNTKEKKMVPLLLPLVADTSRDVVLRKMAVRSLAQTQEGAGDLIGLAKEEKLPADLKLTASTELNSVRWPKIKNEAAQVLPLPQGQNAEPLPPIAELARVKGNLSNGEMIFFRETSVCAKCHQAKGRGGDVGPNLSEIGTKLGKDALFEAILEPSAGISLGYEASQVELKSGDEAYGIVISETGDELAVKDLNGIVNRYKKTDIARRRLSKTSLMPTGLAATMTTQELVDLVEYLAALKKAGN